MSDVLIIGGGVIGLSIARELASASLSVTVLDRQAPGREASWAGAGILPPTVPGLEDDPLALLTRASHGLWPDLSEELLSTTGIDNGFRQCGGIQIDPASSSVPAIRLEPVQNGTYLNAEEQWRAAGAQVEPLSPNDLSRLEPNLTVKRPGAFRLPEVCQVRNPRHLKALIERCSQIGVNLLADHAVEEILLSNRGIQAIQTRQGRFTANKYIVAAGAWSARLIKRLGIDLDVVPVRGQILQLKREQPPFTHVIECGPRYIVPREDGLILVGATEEDVGFQKANTDQGLSGLLEFAGELVPALKTAKVVDAWSGLRPHRRCGRPVISSAGGVENLHIATGHFRSGLHLSAITGRLVRQQILGELPDVPLDAFRLNQFV